MATKRSTETTETTEATESVPGLVEAPKGGSFFIRAVPEEERSGDGDAKYLMILRVEGEEEYSTKLFAVDDGSITGTAYNLLAIRRQELRENLVETNSEVKVTP